ncbi:MAG: flagellar hook-basal body protein [Planctomycetota bacterium]
MNYGLYLSANGALTSLHRQDVLANNLANVETVGFKPDMVYTRQRDVERVESGAAVEPRFMLEQLGGGHLVAPSSIGMNQGPLQRTDAPLDLAITGQGLFVVAPQDGSAEDRRLTRDGRFTIDADGFLASMSSGMRVLDVANRPMHLDPNGALAVDSRGTLRQDGRVVGQLRIANTDANELTKVGSNLFHAPADALRDAPIDSTVRQGFVEASAVDPIDALQDLIDATRASQANIKLMQYHDFLTGQAVNRFARVA